MNRKDTLYYWGYLAIAIFIFVLTPTQPARAYLDPGSGSMIVQAVIGSVIGGGYVIKSFWFRITSSLRKPVKESEKTDNDTTT